MGERTTPGPVCGCNDPIREAVCVHTSKVYDACRSKECIPELRVYLTRQSQELLDRSNSVKPRRAELIWVNLDVEPVDFNRGFFSVDARFFYRVYAEVNAGCGRMTDICGLAVYDKRAILFGCESSVRTFTSEACGEGLSPRTIEQGRMPRAVVETLDPIVLSAKIVEPHCRCDCCCHDDDIPEYLGCMFDEDLILNGDVKKLFVTLGQFSIIRLERDAQLLIPAYDVCMPTKECNCGSSEPEDPCEMFNQIDFPEEEFNPVCREPKPREHGCHSGDSQHECRKCGSR
ncbi:MAG: hypothetical protein Q4F79_07260 [Eubacteriales bacterium]|nr:hypothetical protein [Eubacteriales bacterium]